MAIVTSVQFLGSLLGCLLLCVLMLLTQRWQRWDRATWTLAAVYSVLGVLVIGVVQAPLWLWAALCGFAVAIYLLRSAWSAWRRVEV